MNHTVTPWAAVAQHDIEKSEKLLELRAAGYYLNLHNAGDSLWLVANWPEGGSIAFRIAFGMNAAFQDVVIKEIPRGVAISARTRLGKYEIALSVPDLEQPVFRYTTNFKADFPMLIPFWPRDIVPLTKDGRVENTGGQVHAHQEGGRSGQLFFSMTKPYNGTVFYFQNLTAMGEYCEVSQTTVVDSVGGSWPEIGFQFPVNKDKPFPDDKFYTISDAFVLMSENIPQKATELTSKYLEYLAQLYALIPLPDTVEHDWFDIAAKGLRDLHTNKGCWTLTNGIPYLNAYVGDYDTPAEIMVQLAVLLPLHEYLEWQGKKHGLYDDLNSGLAAFYDRRVNSIVRWHPALEDKLDKSEEQKREMVMDSWYLHHPLLNLARLALRNDKVAKQLFLDSIDYAIKVAHHFDYDWPVFYKMTTLEVLKAETVPGAGGEKDVPGSYAHVMLLAWKLTGERRFLTEAVTSARKLDGKAFEIFYQANNTAFTAGALLDLYKETDDKFYLDLSYSCIAAVFRNTQIWDCNYGYGKFYQSFFAVFPLSDAPYTAAYEELEVYAALYHYLQSAVGIEIHPALYVLIPEFVKYTVSRLPYYYPSKLPQDMIDETVKTGEIQKDLWIPLEDIHDGWEKSGGVGQEVYGAGIAFGVVPRQYIRIDENFVIFVDYPFRNYRKARNFITLDIIGNRAFSCSLILVNIPKATWDTLSVEMKLDASYEHVSAVEGSRNRKFTLKGDARIRLSWK